MLAARTAKQMTRCPTKKGHRLSKDDSHLCGRLVFRGVWSAHNMTLITSQAPPPSAHAQHLKNTRVYFSHVLAFTQAGPVNGTVPKAPPRADEAAGGRSLARMRMKCKRGENDLYHHYY